MKNYRIEFSIDTGYEILYRECIIVENSEKKAIENFWKWLKTRYKDLPSQWIVVDSEDKIKVTEIESEGFGIVFQNLFKKKAKEK